MTPTPKPKPKTRDARYWLDAFTSTPEELAYEQADFAKAMKMTPNRTVTPTDIQSSILPPATGADPFKVKPAEAKASGTDWLAMGIDAAKAGISAIGASQTLPTRQRNPELARVEAELKAKADNGLTAADRIGLMRQQAAGYAKDIDAIGSALGGGGSAAAVVAGLGAASNRSMAVGTQTEAADRSVKDANLQAYYNALKGAQGEDDQQYTNAYNNTVASRDAFGRALGANLTQITDRVQYDKAYGAGSSYSDFIERTRKRRMADQGYADKGVTSLAF